MKKKHAARLGPQLKSGVVVARNLVLVVLITTALNLSLRNSNTYPCLRCILRNSQNMLHRINNPWLFTNKKKLSVISERLGPELIPLTGGS